MLSNISITPIDPTQLVVPVEEVERELVVDYPVSEDDIKREIQAATQALQEFTGLAFVPSTVSLTAQQRSRSEYFILPYSNGAVDENIRGNRYYTNESSLDITYTCGEEPTDWMKQGVLKYVVDLFENRGDIKHEVGYDAKQYCKNFISHGSFF